MANTDFRKFPDMRVSFNRKPWLDSRHRLKNGGRSRSPGDRAERADQAVVVGKSVLGHLAGIHDVGQAGKHRVGEPVTAQIVPNPLDWIELGTVRRQRQQRDIAGHHEALAAVPTGTIEDDHGMSIGGDLAADLAEMMVHRDGIADRHDQRRRFALQWADRTKHIGRGKAEVLWCRRPASGLPPHPGQAVFLAEASLILEPYLDSYTVWLCRPDSL